MERIKEVFILFFATIALIGCEKDANKEITDISATEEVKSVQAKSALNPILEMSYKITTSRDYDVIPEKLSNLDLSTVNPSSEKQSVTMNLFENGQMNITIKKMDFERKIKIAHKTLPDDSPKITKTVISGNTIRFYDKDEKLLNTEKFSMPNHTEMIRKIKEIGKQFSAEDINETIATMQGHQFIKNLESFITTLR